MDKVFHKEYRIKINCSISFFSDTTFLDLFFTDLLKFNWMKQQRWFDQTKCWFCHILVLPDALIHQPQTTLVRTLLQVVFFFVLFFLFCTCFVESGPVSWKHLCLLFPHSGSYFTVLCRWGAEPQEETGSESGTVFISTLFYYIKMTLLSIFCNNLILWQVKSGQTLNSGGGQDLLLET